MGRQTKNSSTMTLAQKNISEHSPPKHEASHGYLTRQVYPSELWHICRTKIQISLSLPGRPLLLFVLVALRGLPSIFGTLEALRIEMCRSSAALYGKYWEIMSCRP